MRMDYPVISNKEAQQILLNRKEELEISLDLGMTKTKIQIKDGNAIIDGNTIPVEDFTKVKEHFLYVVEDNELKKVAVFSDETNLYYKLMPTSDWPTFTLSSTPMHRHTHISPKQDTQTKIEEISPVKGKVLDTCCGAGYTAIMSSKDADEVHTFERDQNVIFLDKINPYSRELFTNPKITLHEKEVDIGINNFKNQYFDRIIHDPPTFKRSPELYSKEFYRELYRVLKKDGILYHYAPKPQKTHGKEFQENIMKNLKLAGFTQMVYHDRSSGIRVRK